MALGVEEVDEEDGWVGVVEVEVEGSFIWIIRLVRVGGGGRVKAFSSAARDRLAVRVLRAAIWGEVEGWYSEVSELDDDEEALRVRCRENCSTTSVMGEVRDVEVEVGGEVAGDSGL